ncbi:DEAD-box type RNA helicase [Serendipita sp. 411]|nr:DEAD-box type RNA helicase [Serendipita sp. 411]
MTSNTTESFNEARISSVIGRLKAGEVRKDILEENELFERFLDPERNPQATHWYCSRATSLLHDVATYSQAWLVANNPQRVTRWKKQHSNLMDTCPDCVKSMEDALLESQFTFLSAYRPDKVSAFMKIHLEWNVERIYQHFLQSPANGTLNDLPPAVSYHIFYNPGILSHRKIWSLACSRLPSSQIKSWPSAFPAGLILLLYQSDTISRWSTMQMDSMPPPVSEESAPRDSHRQRALQSLLVALANSSGNGIVISDSVAFSEVFENVTSLLLWTSMPTILPLFPEISRIRVRIPSGALEQGGNQSLLMIIITHLSRSDRVFEPVQRTFETFLKQLGPKAWMDQPQNLPLVALSAIKENKRVFSSDSRSSGSSLEWIQPFLETVIGSSVYNDVLHRIFQMFAQEAQHQQRDESRSAMFAHFLTALEEAHKLPSSSTIDHKQAIIEATKVHIDMVIAVAFEKLFDQQQWATARLQTRRFLAELLKHDVRQIQSALFRISEAGSDVKEPPPTISTSYTTIWSRLRAALRPDDLEGHMFFIELMSYSSQLSVMWSQESLNSRPEAIGIKLREIEGLIQNMHDGFDECMLKLINAGDPSALAVMTNRRDIVSNLIPLFISPSSILVEGAQTLIVQIHNVDGRSECFRVLLEKQSDGSVEGMVNHLRTVLSTISKYPAVSVAQTLVVCYSDVLDVLCTRGSGLLFDQSFKAKNKQIAKILPLLWKHMCQVAGNIIEKTPSWSQLFHPSKMIPWMNDALIFANKLVEQRNIFESAALASQDDKQTGSRGDIVLDLEAILSPLLSWLRLSNQELLDRSYDLLLTMIDAFHQTERRPDQRTLDKFKGTIKKWLDASSVVSQENNKYTKLGSDRLGTLLKRIGRLDGDEDSDVEFISQSFSPRRPTQLPTRVQDPKFPSIRSFHTNTVESKSLGNGAIPKSQPPESARTGGVPKRGSSHAAGLDKEMVQSAIRERKEAKAAKNRATKPVAAMKQSSPSSSEEESDDDGEAGLAPLSTLGKIPTKAPPKGRRSAILLNGLGGSKRGTIAQAEAKTVHKYQTRFIPDLTPLHRIILSWDYDHIGPEPPTIGGPLNLKAVPDLFTSHRHYLDVFHPLLILECWNSMVKSKEELLEKAKCTLAGKVHADFWVELDVTIEQSVTNNWNLAETDIILMQHALGQRRLAKVHSVRQTKQGSQATLRYSSEVTKIEFERVCTLQSEWILSKVFSLSTIHREYTALMGMGTYECAEAVFRAQINSPLAPSDPDIRHAMEMHRLNYPQARAILSSMRTRGFSLIQGPPGTGKTSTICGLVGAFLSSRKPPPVAVLAGRSGQKPIPRKVLVCAPSNAAIDEVTKRIKDGVWGGEGKKVLPEVVRLGSINSMNVSVRDASLDQLIEDRLSKSSSGKADDTSSEIASLRNELARVKQLRQLKQEEAQGCKNNPSRFLEIDKELRELTSKRIHLSNRLTIAQDKGKAAARTMDSAKRKTRLDILNEADVICCTLSGSGHETIEQLDFDLVIIDEAAQAIELSSLIPLKFSSNHCVMVGDPQQLPPTVISQTATKHGYNQSLFVRLQKALPDRIHLLSIQYRMHPDISRLPSTLFYGGRLQDGPEMAIKTAQPWHESTALGIYRFFNVLGTEIQADLGHSQWNQAEVQAAVNLYQKLRSDFPTVNFDYRIGIISMYRAQLSKLREAFSSRFGRDVLSKVDFNTVDGFQGQEKDIIILSCVRAGVNVTSIGFLSDARRMNVAITRCRSSLYILGHASTLKRSDVLWANIVSDADDRGVLIQVDDSTFQRSGAQEMKSVVNGSTQQESKIRNPKPGRVPPRSLKALTPKEWRSLNDKTATPTQGDNNTLNLDTPSTSTTPTLVETAEVFTGASKPPPVIPQKRPHSASDDTKREPPALRNSLETKDAPSTSDPEPSASVRSIARPRPPKPSGSNLFIPKKPIIKPSRPPNAS